MVNSTEISAKPEHGFRWLVSAKFNRAILHWHEKAMASLLAEIKRVAACMNMPRCVVDEAEALAKRYADAVSGRNEVVAVALLWLAARRAKVLKPLREFLRCGRVEKGEVAWIMTQLAELAKSSAERPRLEEYVWIVAARLSLPADVAKRALEILRRNRRLLVGKNPWTCAAAALYLAANRQISAWQFATAAGVTNRSVTKLANKMRV